MSLIYRLIFGAIVLGHGLSAMDLDPTPVFNKDISLWIDKNLIALTPQEGQFVYASHLNSFGRQLNEILTVPPVLICTASACQNRWDVKTLG